ncbi:Serine/threonine kinase [Xylographa parallela]|nr:Serine/threonine kinase [Xylographa parallela]
MNHNDDLINQIYKKIERERVLINAANNMRQSSNPQVQQSLDAQIKEGRKNISYLEERLNALKMQSMGQGMESMSMGSGSNGGPLPPSHGALSPQQQSLRNNSFSPSSLNQGRGRGGYPSDQGSYGGPAQGGYMDQMGAGSGMMPPRPPYGPSAPGSSVPKARPNYSKLDLIKADTSYLGPRFQLMLTQLTFKLSVEKQYKDGIEKLVRLYSDDGDKRSRADAEGRRVESNQKIQLLKQALKRYEDLHVDMEGSTDAADDDSLNTPNLRKPLTGHLSMRIHAVKDVNHAITGRFSKGPETFVIIKVEDALKARTKATRTDRWTDEMHSIEIEKANEIELTVYDKSGQYPTPIGMLWIRIADIVEEMRRKKIETELSGSQWVTAEQMDHGLGNPQGSSYNSFSMNLPQDRSARGPSGRDTPSGGQSHHSDPGVIEAWFALEPVGSIKISMSFTKHAKDKRPFDLGLNRKGAVRQRKEEVQEQYGHKFVLQQFYSIMRCALCGDFLKYSAGMQCEDCKYTCHQKCFSKVVTKCISKSNAETDPDEEKLNHRIPHRFEGFSNMGANWCCHCGYILPFGRKNCRKCTECQLTVHAQCAHLVPDFCGMSMLRANEILSQIRGIPKKPPPMDHKLQPTLRQGGPSKAGRPTPALQPSYATPQANDQSSRPVADQRRSYGLDQPYDQQTRPGPSQGPGQGPIPGPGAGYSAVAQRAAIQAATPQSPTYGERPGLTSRTTSSQDAAAAAAAAITGKRTPSQKSTPYTPATSDYNTRPGGRAPGSYAQAPPMESHAELEAEPQQDSRRTSQQPQQSQYDPAAYAGYGSGYPPQPQAQQYPPSSVQQYPPKSSYNELAQAQQTQPTQTLIKTQPIPGKDSPPQAQGRGRIGLEHFNFLAVLGKGNFGKVMLAETKATKKLYAIKVLKKEFIIENDEVESTKSEKRVFLIANKERHPFLLNLHACFQTETRVYFVMEYISGGDLMLHIQRGQFGLKRAQFYAAEVCLALKYFHENGVIYRDLKLDNIMLTLDGHIKVGDYGLCKEDMWYGSTTSTFCGTPEFMAPEILLDKKYGRAVDWWAFGVLIYQMLLQQSPFRGEDEDEIYDAILADEPLYPIHMPRDSVSILQKLLTREPELRLGSGPTDAQEIMSHSFFRNINWDDVHDKKVPPPFQPSITSATDTSNFDSEFTSVTPVLTPVQSVLTQAMQEEFRGFSYSADFI